MNPHKFISLILVCTIAFSCKKDEIDPKPGPGQGGAVDYQLLVTTANGFKAISLDADQDSMTLSTTMNGFSMTSEPHPTYRDGSVFSFYQKTGDCSARFLNYNFIDGSSREIDLFADLGSCDLDPYAVAHHADKGYVAYGLDNGSASAHYVGAFGLNGPPNDFVDIPLTKKPVQLGFANGRLFVLTIDDQYTHENSLTVIDAATNAELIEINLGYDAQKLIRNTDGNMIVCYDELHTLLGLS